MLHARRREMRELIRAGRVVAWPLVKYKGAIALSCITYFAIRSKSTTKIMRKLGPVPCLIVPLFTNRHWIPDISNNLPHDTPKGTKLLRYLVVSFERSYSQSQQRNRQITTIWVPLQCVSSDNTKCPTAKFNHENLRRHDPECTLT